ncbi:MAG: phosphopyruvate hydratase [Desulfuromonadales bacterium C00003094]|nr:MAG: phosphopyruvate hydratase [Desulfuromonadales bacterium C00003094]
MPYTIEYIHAREILDSRGNPTVEVDLATPSGFGRAGVPSGASTGTNEALELRDGGDRYRGKGVLKAVENVNTVLRNEIIGMDVRDQRAIDLMMIDLDGTPDKSNLGANAILGVSMAAARAAADSADLPLYTYLGGTGAYTLPCPTMNVLNGGEHAGNELAIQEFMIQPRSASTCAESIRIGAEVYHELKSILTKKYGSGAGNVGDEGGYAPPMDHTSQAFDSLIAAIEEAGYTTTEVTVGIDAAASEFFENGRYAIDGTTLDGGEMLEYYLDLIKTYPILVIEDPFHEDAFEDFAALTSATDRIVIGDDIFVTNIERLQRGIDVGAANALLLKLNQIGTVSEAFDAARLAHRSGYRVVVSHRSAETCDHIIADVAVAVGADLLKTGAPARSERASKYNQLMRIEEELGEAAKFAQI